MQSIKLQLPGEAHSSCILAQLATLAIKESDTANLFSAGARANSRSNAFSNGGNAIANSRANAVSRFGNAAANSRSNAFSNGGNAIANSRANAVSGFRGLLQYGELHSGSVRCASMHCDQHGGCELPAFASIFDVTQHDCLIDYQL